MSETTYLCCDDDLTGRLDIDWVEKAWVDWRAAAMAKAAINAYLFIMVYEMIGWILFDKMLCSIHLVIFMEPSQA